jgi:ribosomal protein L40E
MAMMSCPHCGAQNSDKRTHCFQCEGDLRGKPKEEARGYMETCQSCSKANLFPPPGVALGQDQVWCLERGEPVAGSRIAGDCFEEAFGWSRNAILD